MPPIYSEEEFHASLDLMDEQPWLKAKKAEYRALLREYPATQQRALLIKLLRGTTHVSASEYHTAFDEIRDKIETNWKLNLDTIVFVSANPDGRISSSHEALNNLRNANWSKRISKSRFVNRFGDAMSQCSTGWNVVIVDDFIGSGQTVIKVINWFKKEAVACSKEIDIFVATVSGCREGLEAIAAGGIATYAKFTVPKSISDLTIGPDQQAAIETMNTIEDLLDKRSKKGALKNYRFGWGRQEAVFYRDFGNTPNNVFPVFWWDTLKVETRKAIMARR